MCHYKRFLLAGAMICLGSWMRPAHAQPAPASTPPAMNSEDLDLLKEMEDLALLKEMKEVLAIEIPAALEKMREEEENQRREDAEQRDNDEKWVRGEVNKIVAFWGDTTAARQQAEDTSAASGIRTPDAPAFSLLGVSPTEIQKPTTPRDLAISLASFIGDDKTIVIPESLAVEVAPYWLKPHDQLTYAEYTKPGLPQLWRNLSLSLATGAQADSATRLLSLGARTQLSWDDDDAHRMCQAVQQSIATAEAPDISKAERERLQAVTGEVAGPKLDAAIKELQAVKQAALQAALQAAKAQPLAACEKLAAAPKFALSFAGALSWTFPDSEISKQAGWDSAAGWLTFAWSRPSASLLGMARLQADKEAMDWNGYADYGVRGVLTHKFLAAGLEALGRNQVFGGSADFQYRIAAQLEVMVKENNWLTISFAKDYGDALVSLANFTTSFGEAQVTNK